MKLKEICEKYAAGAYDFDPEAKKAIAELLDMVVADCTSCHAPKYIYVSGSGPRGSHGGWSRASWAVASAFGRPLI